MASYDTYKDRDKAEVGSEKTFGLFFSVIFLLVALWPWFHGEEYIRTWAFCTSVILCAISITIPKTLSVPNRLWFKLGMVLHKIVNPFIMGALFFLVVVPIGLFMKVFGKDLLNLKLDNMAKSYWLPRTPQGPQKGSMRDQF
ncbi:MAG: SxtJ family membrane protein [Alphaproteobacteria bacterium]|jgi:hypothetical protein|nr:SxtJ family membrane protein [Alphaproteobacteria bacterium]MDP7222679.1 SxtJ family membrane protein [Alphaproteobacteria bacterium]